MTVARGFGVAGALDHGILREVARDVEERGYQTLWVNDTPSGDALAALAEAARVTSRVRLATGVIPLDRQPAARVVERVRGLDLPLDRLVLGVGSGRAKHALDLMRHSVGELRTLGSATIVVGALGPKMCAVAGSVADGVLLNWLTAPFAAESAAIARRAASEANRPEPAIDGYVRVALGAAALPRLRQEADRYAAFPSYAANFRRMGSDAIDTAVAGDTAAAVQTGLAAYDAALDETIVRAITAEETLPAYLALVDAAAPR